MKIVLLANNRAGWEAAEFLARRDDTNIVLLVVHPDEKQRYKREIKMALPHVPRIIEADRLDDSIDYIRATGAELALSVYYGYILREPFLSLFPQGIVNLHPAWLPWNRGAHSIAWSIIDSTPCGVTLHYIDAGIDTGDIIAQEPIVIEPTDTGGSLYLKAERAGQELLKEIWPLIISGNAPRMKQKPGGTFHKAADLEKLRLNLDAKQEVRKTIDILRALTWPRNHGTRYMAGWQNVVARISIEKEHNA